MNALIVEDNPQQAERIAQLLAVPGRLEVVATHATEDSAIEACDRFRIDVAVVDLQLAQGTGFQVIRHLRKVRGPEVLIIVLTNHAVPALKVAAFEASADYFLDKAKDFATLPRLAAELLARELAEDRRA